MSATSEAPSPIRKRGPRADRQAFTMPDLRGFMDGEMPPPRFAVDGLVPIDAVTLLGGHGGSGKSVAGLTIAAHSAASRAWAGRTVAGGLGVFVSLEDPALLVLHRLRRITAAYALPADTVAANLRIIDGTQGPTALGMEDIECGVRRFRPTPQFDELRVLVQGASLIVVDNASDAFDGNENERRQVRAFVRMLTTLARENEAGVLLLAHIDKAAARSGAAGNTYSGSTAWHNSARSRLALVEANGAIELRQEKNNLGRLAAPIRLAWSEHGVLVPATPGELAGADETDDDAQAVLGALREAARQGVSVPTARTGPATAHRVLETFDALPGALRGRQGRDRFWRALGRLQRDGCASSEPYRNAERKVKTRLIVGDAPVPRARQSPTTPVNRRGEPAHGAPVCTSDGTGAELAQTGGSAEEVEL